MQRGLTISHIEATKRQADRGAEYALKSLIRMANDTDPDRRKIAKDALRRHYEEKAARENK